MTDFVTSLIGRTHRKDGIDGEIVAVYANEGGLRVVVLTQHGGLLDFHSANVKVLMPPHETLMTDGQKKKTGGYIPRIGQLVLWETQDWDTGRKTTFRGRVTNFAAIDPGGTIILTVDTGEPEPVSVRADQIQSFVEPENVKP